MTQEEIEKARADLTAALNQSVLEAVDAALQGAIRICTTMDSTRCVPAIEAYRKAVLQSVGDELNTSIESNLEKWK